LNPKTDIFLVKHGVEFLSWRFFVRESGKIVRKLKRQSKLRFKWTVGKLKRGMISGELEINGARQVLANYRGHLSHGHA